MKSLTAAIAELLANHQPPLTTGTPTTYTCKYAPTGFTFIVMEPEPLSPAELAQIAAGGTVCVAE